MKHTMFNHKGKDCYIGGDGYCSIWVDHTKGEYITIANQSHSMSLHRFHRYIIEMLGIEAYHDNTMQDYIARTSDKKLKAQGLKRI